jgi:hypothetical protein
MCFPVLKLFVVWFLDFFILFLVFKKGKIWVLARFIDPFVSKQTADVILVAFGTLMTSNGSGCHRCGCQQLLLLLH